MKNFDNKELIDINEAYQKMQLWFFSYPDREMGLSDLALNLGISKKTTNLIVTKLSNEGFLKKEILGKTWRISCNKEHKYNLSRKISFNLTMIYESGILERVHQLIQNPNTIILFGSYRKGDDNEKSDIDIAVEVFDNKEIEIIESGIIRKFGFRENVPVNIHVFSRNKIDLNVFANISNGIVLEGFLEVRP